MLANHHGVEGFTDDEPTSSLMRKLVLRIALGCLAGLAVAIAAYLFLPAIGSVSPSAQMLTLQ